MTNQRTTSAGLLLGRLLLAIIFVHEGWDIIGSYAGAMAYMQKSDVPGALLPAVIALQLGGGMLIAACPHAGRVVGIAASACSRRVFHWQRRP